MSEAKILNELKELRQENHYLRQLIQLPPGDFYIKDKMGKILIHNDNYKKHLIESGFLSGKDDELVGKSQAEIFTRDNAENYRITDLEVMNTLTPKLVEETVTSSVGVKQKLVVLKIPLFAIETGQVDGVICYCQSADELKGAQGNIKLSDREMECLSALFYGMTAKQAAIAMGISFRTVEIHMNNMKNKIGCMDKSSAVEFVKSQGLEMIMEYHYNKFTGKEVMDSIKAPDKK